MKKAASPRGRPPPRPERAASRPEGRGGPGRAAPGEIVVDGYSERWLRRGFPWVYPKEIVAGRPRPGELVTVRAGNGDVLGRGLGDEGWIAARVMRHDDGPVDADWADGVVARALALRDAIIDPDTDAFRLIHAENDGLPGVRVDHWAGHLVVTLDTPAVASLVAPVLDAIARRRPVGSVHLAYRPDPRDPRDFARAEPAAGRWRGEAPGDVIVRERGLRFRVRPAEGPDVGLYADMRATRAWMAPHWRGRRVLNTFAYTGAFSVAAAAGGAAEVLTVDLSEKYLARARENFAENGLGADDAAFVAEDTFRALDRLRRKGERFDVVIVDPPSFSHGPDGTWSAERDYPRLVAAACRVLAADGWLVAATNLGQLSPHQWQGEVEDGVRRADRRAQELMRGFQSPDFPAASWFPEGRYLKVGVWRVW